MKGIVIKSTGSWYVVRAEDGKVMECRIKGKFRLDQSKNTNPVAVGDRVEFELESEENKGIIVKLETRKNYIIRRSTNLSKQSHILAANIDQAFLLVTTCGPRTSRGFIDRFLVTAEAYSVPVSLIFSKVDTYKAIDRPELDALRRLYEGVGYSCLELSSVTSQGIAELKKLTRGRTTLFAGHSGAGKSALVNALDNSLNVKTGILSEAHDKGKHTTTFAELFELKEGGFVIDTPGIKEFGMFDLKKEELSHFFPEIRAFFNRCKYDSCLHLTEPGCAVKLAVSKGEIAESRYDTYHGIMTSDELKKEY